MIDGVIGIAARGGEDGLPDAYFRLVEGGFEPAALGISTGIFALPPGNEGRFAPLPIEP